MDDKAKISVLFVCMGNICRSPTAEGVFRKFVADAGLAEAIRIESAGTHAYHTGQPPDRRAQAVAERRGYQLSSIRARRVAETDYQEFTYIIAMDEDNLSLLREGRGDDATAELLLFLEFSENDEREVPDPYYGGTAGFERVLDLVEQASRDFLAHIRQRNQL